MAVPYTFGSATTSIPLSQLDSNFATTITLGNTAIQLGNTVTTLNNMTFANATVSSGNITVLNATVTNDASISGLTVGKGGGANANNTAVGVSALNSNTTGSSNTAIGYQAGSSVVGNGPITAVGYQAGKTYNAADDWGSVYVGYSAGVVATGKDNVVVGGSALAANTSGASNTAIGAAALKLNTTASNNTAVGYQAGYSNTTGAGNTSIGILAGAGVTTANASIFVGQNAGYPNGGVSGGANLTTGSGVYIGYYASASSSSVVREGVLNTSGAGAVGKGTDTWYINAQSGLSTGGSYYNGANTTTWNTTSDQRLKKNIVDNTDGLDIINKIQVRNFEYRLPEEVTELPLGQAIQKQGVQLGVIAQELQQILPECVKTESTGVMTVDADNLTWYLINAVKELSARVKQLEGN